jgi:hypothetical protein
MNRGPIMDRALEPAWLDVALQVALDAHPHAARSVLAMRLRDRIDLRDRWDKRLTVLSRIWLNPPAVARPCVAWALERAHRVGDPRPLHIGAMLAAYPFFGDVCAAVGRELSLQGEAFVTSVRRRLRQRWGDRVEVDVATRAAIRTIRKLGLVSGSKGALRVGRGERLPVPSALAPWLVHALLLTRCSQEIDVRQVRGSPELFMVELPRSWSSKYPYLERFNEGGGGTVLRLRKVDVGAGDGERQTRLFNT